MENLHIPSPSGSNALLRAMHRGYWPEWYIEILTAIRSHMPEATVFEMIEGIPGEAEDNFDECER